MGNNGGAMNRYNHTLFNKNPSEGARLMMLGQ